MLDCCSFEMDSLVGGFFSLVFLRWDFLPAVQVKDKIKCGSHLGGFTGLCKWKIIQCWIPEKDWNTLGDFSKAWLNMSSKIITIWYIYSCLYLCLMNTRHLSWYKLIMFQWFLKDHMTLKNKNGHNILTTASRKKYWLQLWHEKK